MPGQATYTAAKAALVGLTQSLALEVVQDGITVNLVAPGLIATPSQPTSRRGRRLPVLRSGQDTGRNRCVRSVSRVRVGIVRHRCGVGGRRRSTTCRNPEVVTRALTDATSRRRRRHDESYALRSRNPRHCQTPAWAARMTFSPRGASASASSFDTRLSSECVLAPRGSVAPSRPPSWEDRPGGQASPDDLTGNTDDYRAGWNRLTTTALAPIWLPAPMMIGPRTFAPRRW